MSGDRDVVLLETVKTHRSRLVSALLFGELEERRPVVDNVRRLVVSLVVAAVACAGCAGTSFVLSVLADQREAQAQQQLEQQQRFGSTGGATTSPTPADTAPADIVRTDGPDPSQIPTTEPR
ncbi:hypothetical protein [Frigoribacterium sp. VKM Ac-2530]|uniref:hypothetical protein n=1 Tax=Frigoribacterium sp. VKM Ac-2530 TaxID=2783822 RepID=UPI00188BA565|nr:hypothetical protein [Frigoribacterium sp. VKM Ac-2530]MBF4580734.1 hypothetical protein [Frigoribacterium sp. VKM Ac-2530]